MNPLVCIILVNYRGYSDTKECIESLIKNDYDNYKIIVVENASGDEEKLLSDEFINSYADVIISKENNGFSAGNNYGIEYASKYFPEYYLLLNNDTIVAPDFVSILIKTASYNKNVGIVTGNIFYYNNKETLWYAGGNYNRKTCVTNQVVFKEYNGTGVEDISFASGCLMLISAECIKKVGKLDEAFFMYSEDTDYCCRALDEGFSIKWVRGCKIYHKVSMSTKKNNDVQNYYLLRNNLLMIKKYGVNKSRAYLTRAWIEIKNVVKKRNRIKIILKAWSDFRKGKTGKQVDF